MSSYLRVEPVKYGFRFFIIFIFVYFMFEINDSYLCRMRVAEFVTYNNIRSMSNSKKTFSTIFFFFCCQNEKEEKRKTVKNTKLILSLTRN